MACCGKQRQQFNGTAQTYQGRKGIASDFSNREQKRSSYAYFQYLGKTGLTVIGPVSGKRYRFDGHGATVAVDLGDRRSLAAVPNLRQVQNPY